MDLSVYLDLFVAEAREHLGSAYALASHPESHGASATALRDVFRHVHSVKGMAASMGFSAMSSLAHDAESLMDHLRDGRMPARAATQRLLCETLACLERMVDRAQQRAEVDDTERSPLQASLRRLLAGETEGTVADPGGSAGASVADGVVRAPAAAGYVNIAAIVRRDRSFPAIRAAVVLGRLAKLGHIVRTEPAMAALRTGRFDGRLLVGLRSEIPIRSLAAKVAAIDEIETFTLAAAEPPEVKAASETPSLSLRVPADRIDALIEDVLELMSTLGRIESKLGLTPGSPAAREGETARRLARRTYDALVEVRLVPFEITTQRLLRAADELSHRLGKTVTLEVSGQDVRIDRSLLEHLMDPLLHMVRNAIDHGIESPKGRQAARKAPVGRLRVGLVRQASRLVLQVEDDGAGLDPRRLKEVAIERGLLTPSEAVRLADAEALTLVTLPGFSTVEETTEVSGRGVGMDVVKATVESLGGRLRIESHPGRGTRFELTLPSSVALVHAYLVRAAGVTFAVPLAAITRMAPMDDNSTAWRDGRRYWSLGAADVPVSTLREVLKLGGDAPERGGMALLTDTAGATSGIEVEEVLGRCEIVVRPLPPPLTGMTGYSGAAVRDDGSIVLVLDPAALPRS